MVANALGRAVKIFKLKLVLLNANSRIERHFCKFMYELRQNNNLDEIRDSTQLILKLNPVRIETCKLNIL